MVYIKKNSCCHCSHEMENYKVTDLLGRGGNGTVFKATHVKGNEVAIKLVDEKSIERWHWTTKQGRVPIEVSLLRHLTDAPGVIRLVDYFKQGKLHCIVMERPRAMDLYDFISTQEGERVPEDTARVLFKRVLDIVHGVHQRGIVHLDIKQENFLIDPSTLQLWLIDFGSGRFRENRRFSSVPGTKEFFPPEYICHKRYYAEKAEVWALGVFLCNLITGVDAFPTPKHTCAGKFYLNENTVSKELVQLLSQALDVAPTRRATLEQLRVSPWVLNS